MEAFIMGNGNKANVMEKALIIGKMGLSILADF